MKRILLLLLGMLVALMAISQPTATEIIEAADQRMQGESNRGTMKMSIVRPKWTRDITMKSWAKGTDYSLVLITAPARDKGTGFLKREKELWNWQPTIDRVIKLPPSMMMQSWMGSDFTNDDLVRQSSIVNDFEHTLEKDTTMMGYDVWKIVLIPKPQAAVVWGKIEAYISKEKYFQLIFKYYDEDQYMVNTLNFSEIRMMGDREIPTRMEMIPAENPEQKTVVVYEDFEFDVELSDQFFSLQNLKRLR
ncbi:MAG: outer membrane lipoprotein-sorting protein [Bacteroidota bacterium]